MQEIFLFYALSQMKIEHQFPQIFSKCFAAIVQGNFDVFYYEHQGQ